MYENKLIPGKFTQAGDVSLFSKIGIRGALHIGGLITPYKTGTGKISAPNIA
jgi:hypothetical protein